MGLINTILASLGTKPEGETGPTQAGGMTGILVGIVGDIINQNGGLEGLMGRFNTKGLGTEFSSWVGLGENKQISAEQIQKVLGNEHVAALAQRFGIDPAQASALISQYLPKIVDKLTPEGKIDPNHDVESHLESLAHAEAGKPGGETKGGTEGVDP